MLDVHYYNFGREALFVKLRGYERPTLQAAPEDHNGIRLGQRFVDDPESGKFGEERGAKKEKSDENQGEEEEEEKTFFQKVEKLRSLIVEELRS